MSESHYATIGVLDCSIIYQTMTSPESKIEAALLHLYIDGFDQCQGVLFTNDLICLVVDFHKFLT